MSFRPTIMGTLLLALTGGVAAGAQGTSQSAETIRLSVGTTRTVALKENPSTGYRWHLNAAESANLAALRISDAGYHQGRSSHLAGAPGMHRWRIEGRTQGAARITFDYSRPWEHVAPARRHVVHVEITRDR
ncbi:MAG: protease inhibitor I42 family protein [Methylovirgula sp.]